VIVLAMMFGSRAVQFGSLFVVCGSLRIESLGHGFISLELGRGILYT
jgi:hypothetical protein